MTFEKYFENLQTANGEQLYDLVKDFMNEWNQNPLVNEFEHKTTKNEFFNLVCKKIILEGVYPASIHKLLVDELTGKQAKMVINNLTLSKECVLDYEAKFLATNLLYEKIDFIEARGINFDAMQNSILKKCDLKAVKYYADTVEKANIKLIVSRLITARSRYSSRASKKLQENRNLCSYLLALNEKRNCRKKNDLEK